MLGELTFNVGIQRTSPRLEWEPKVIWIWQPDCKSGLSGSGSSPQGPTIYSRQIELVHTKVSQAFISRVRFSSLLLFLLIFLVLFPPQWG